MASPPMLDLDAVVSAPAGDGPPTVPYQERAELDDARKDKEDTANAGQYARPDWAKIITQAHKVLTTRSKDLAVAVRLVEAMFQQQGFAAVPHGFRFLRRLLEEAWDHLSPPPDEDGDISARGSCLNWLCTPSRGALFPNSLRLRPIFRGKVQDYSYTDYQRAQEGRPEIDKGDLDKAIAAFPAKECERLVNALGEAQEELSNLTRVAVEKLAGEAPDTSELASAVHNCHQLLQQVWQTKKPPEDGQAGAGEAPADGETGGGAGLRPGRAAATRAEAYRQIAQAAAVLRELEPHSPIPYLVQRAVEMGALPFPQMIRELVREPNVLAELFREVGVKDAGSPEVSTPPEES